ncbi:efflux RND transporter periplasmic adaptor subunit [Swaminathania salitolerans]|uniref:MexX family efflux pump subunit n=1 Tax=Swaminathania salitolerans TaxID=182838 RepID=A0A511BNK5_9PROT|nr:efflux RND transporter periplasmic adaptor subunit [Swaminathania salitolerans]GBQ14881.1 multidrug efflux pump acriflavin resistance protein AcrB/AcrD/AcrF [Swaminathania salitolerans LMG 21291]GEL01919.1 MexX family efflux pump subunit [Swaminathania salitolerans]
MRSTTSLSLKVIPLALLTLDLGGCKHENKAQQPPPQQVGVVTIHPHALKTSTSLPGRVEAFEQAQIRPQVGGLILKRCFEQGTDVKAGQLLYVINPAPFKASYDQARAQLLHARAASLSIKAQLERYRPLAAAHAVSKQDYDNTLSSARQAEADIAQAQANLDSAKVNLDWTQVRSPIDGRIGRMLVTPGTLVTAGQTTAIATVTRMDPIYVDVNLATSDMLRLRREMASGKLEKVEGNAASVGLTLEDGSHYDIPGKLRLTEVTVDPATGTMVVRAEFPNPDKLLMPGMYVHAEIAEGVDPKAVTIPQQALQRDSKGDPFVYTVDKDDKVAVRMVQLDHAVGSEWVLFSGLNEGDRVIFNGIQKAHPGAKVKPVEKTEDAKPAHAG